LKTKHFVRQSLFLTLIFYALIQGDRLPATAENLPQIDARQFELVPKEISRSGRVYRFRLEGTLPRTGNLILIQMGDRPVMAFRVLKTEASSKDVIAKRIRRYDQEGKLDLEKKYSAIEKVADLVSPPDVVTPAPSTEARASSLPLTAGAPKEEPIEPIPGAPPAGSPLPESTPAGSPLPESTPASTPASPAPDPNAPALLGDDGSGAQKSETPTQTPSVEGFDEDLDATTSPRDLKNEFSKSDQEEGASGSRSGPGIEERESLIKYQHMAGLSVGSFRNMSGFSIPGTTHYGFTAYYNEVVDKGIWFHNLAPEDTLSLEFGLGYYSRVNLTGSTDNYDVIPIRTELLYTLQFNPTFAFITEVGAQFNWVIAAENATEIGLATLSGIQPNFAIGMLYNIGPQWYLRTDLGLDRIAIGLAVKW